MKQQPRIYYTETDKSLMWDRWQKGESLNSIGCRCVIVRARQRVGPIGQPYTVFIS